VGELVCYCEQHNKKLAEVSVDEFKKYSALIEADVYEVLGAGNVVSKYVSEGAAGAGQVKEQIAFWNERLAQR